MGFRLVGRAFDPGGQALDPSILKIGDTWHIFSGRREADRTATGTALRATEGSLPPLGTMSFIADGAGHMMANGLAVPGGLPLLRLQQSPARSIAPHRLIFHTRDGKAWTADLGSRLTTGGQADLEMPGFGPLDPAVGRLKDGTYLMVYPTRIPGT